MIAHFKWEEMVDPETETRVGRLMFHCQAYEFAAGCLLSEHSSLEEIATGLESMARLIRERDTLEKRESEL